MHGTVRAAARSTSRGLSVYAVAPCPYAWAAGSPVLPHRAPLLLRPLLARSLSSSAAAGQQAESGEGAAAAGGSAKPRAASGIAQGRRRRHYLLAALLGGPLAFVGYLAYKYRSVEEAVEDLRGVFEGVKEAGVADPTHDELARALGPPSPEFYISVLIAMEDVVLRREWDRRYGWRYEIRPGVKEMFKALLEAGASATLWSDTSAAVAMDTVGRLSMDFGMSLPITQLHLGPEHCFSGPSPGPGKPPRKEKHIQHFNRDPTTVLLIDFDQLSEECNPANTVIVKPMSAVAAEAAEAERTGSPPPADTAMRAIVQLVQRIRAEAAATGEVNVPAALAALRREASAQGFPQDAAGLASYLQAEADAAVELDRIRQEGGLGGLLRRVAEAMPVLRGKATLAEVAAARPFRDPVWECGPGSLLASRVAVANARLDASMRGGR